MTRCGHPKSSPSRCAQLDGAVAFPARGLRHTQSKPYSVELVPGNPRLEVPLFFADPAVTRDELEAELGDVARLDITHLAGHQVVVEELHAIYARPWCC